jgi:hypothetical protein
MKNVFNAIAGLALLTVLNSSCSKTICVYKTDSLKASKASNSSSFVKLKNAIRTAEKTMDSGM